MTVPHHIALIMDGNGRWAQRRGYPRVYGHVKGASRISEVAREADRMGVKAITLYAFSTENWSRPEAERRVLWAILKKFIRREESVLMRDNVRLRVIGEVERLPEDARAVLLPAIERLSKNSGLNLTLAISYGSRRELARAAQLIAIECTQGRLSPESIDEKTIEQYLWTESLKELSDVDLVIRTSGEHRVSNFLLWQAAYAEFCFFDIAWPDFSALHLREAIAQFNQRDRRYGAIKSEQTVEKKET